MFRGTMIDELINAVKKAETQASARVARPSLPPPMPARRAHIYPAFTYMYDFSTMQQMVVGVA